MGKHADWLTEAVEAAEFQATREIVPTRAKICLNRLGFEIRLDEMSGDVSSRRHLSQVLSFEQFMLGRANQLLEAVEFVFAKWRKDRAG